MTLVAGSLKQLRGPCFARPPLSNIIHASQRSRPISQASSQAPGPISSLIPFVQGIIGTHTQQQLDKPQGGSRDQVPAEDLAELTPIPTTTLACRAALLAVAVAAGVWHVEADAAVQRVWDSMRASPWVQVGRGSSYDECSDLSRSTVILLPSLHALVVGVAFIAVGHL